MKTSEAPTAEASRFTDTPGDKVMVESARVTPTWRSSFPAMGTRVDIISWSGDGMVTASAAAGVVARRKDVWSVLQPSSEVSRLNIAVVSTGCGGGAPRCRANSAVAGLGLIVNEETDRLPRDMLALAEATGKALDPLIGPLVAVWDVKPMRITYVAGTPLPPVPSEHIMEAALRASSWGSLSRAGERRWTMGLPGKPVDGIDVSSSSLDPGGTTKGYTADACRDLAMAMGACGVLVSVGTPPVSMFGTRVDGSSRHAGLHSPQGGPMLVADIVELPAGGMASLSTSGDNLGPLGGVHTICAESAMGSVISLLVGPATDRHARETLCKASVGGGCAFDHHITDPRMGCPAHAGVRQISVVASSDALAGVLPMALLVGPSIGVSDVVARWSRLSDTLASTRVVGIVRARQG